MKIGFVTCRDLSRYFDSKDEPLFTHDDLEAVRFLREKGHQVDPIVWSDNAANLLEYDKVVVRSPWDYMDSPENRKAFTEWIEYCHVSGVHLFNQADLLKWNLDKIYLRDLENRGVSIVPSIFVDPQDPLTKQKLEDLLRARKKVVLKPRISAAARDTFVINEFEDIDHLESANGKVEGDFDSFASGRGFIIQEFVSSVVDRGEWSLVFFAGIYSHCVLKRPKKGGWLVQDELGGSVESLEPPAELIEFGKLTIEKITEHTKEVFAVEAPPLYARVDIVVLADESLALGEVELIEPELFFLRRLKNKVEVNLKALQLFYNALMS